VYFGVTLFLALVALIKWKRRRDLATARVNRGLRGYVAAEGPAEGTAEVPAAEETQKESLLPIP
jgi:hypothetical protein